MIPLLEESFQSPHYAAHGAVRFVPRVEILIRNFDMAAIFNSGEVEDFDTFDQCCSGGGEFDLCFQQVSKSPPHARTSLPRA